MMDRRSFIKTGIGVASLPLVGKLVANDVLDVGDTIKQGVCIGYEPLDGHARLVVQYSIYMDRSQGRLDVICNDGIQKTVSFIAPFPPGNNRFQEGIIKPLEEALVLLNESINGRSFVSADYVKDIDHCSQIKV